MKTSIEISDALLAEAREFARSNNTTVKALVEAGLRKVIAQPPKGKFKLRVASTDKVRLPREWEKGDWSGFREDVYPDNEAPTGERTKVRS